MMHSIVKTELAEANVGLEGELLEKAAAVAADALIDRGFTYQVMPEMDDYAITSVNEKPKQKVGFMP